MELLCGIEPLPHNIFLQSLLKPAKPQEQVKIFSLPHKQLQPGQTLWYLTCSMTINSNR